MLASRTGSAEVVGALLAAGADVNAREAWRDQTALMWAAEGAFPELVKLLIEHGADVRARAAANDWGSQITSEPRAQYRPTGGLTPLLYAARSGCAECVSAILAAGEAVDRPTPDGVTALMLAIDNYEFDTAKVLLEAGANPHVSGLVGPHGAVSRRRHEHLRAARGRRARALEEHDRHGSRATSCWQPASR